MLFPSLTVEADVSARFLASSKKQEQIAGYPPPYLFLYFFIFADSTVTRRRDTSSFFRDVSVFVCFLSAYKISSECGETAPSPVEMSWL